MAVLGHLPPVDRLMEPALPKLRLLLPPAFLDLVALLAAECVMYLLVFQLRAEIIAVLLAGVVIGLACGFFLALPRLVVEFRTEFVRVEVVPAQIGWVLGFEAFLAVVEVVVMIILPLLNKRFTPVRHRPTQMRPIIIPYPIQIPRRAQIPRRIHFFIGPSRVHRRHIVVRCVQVLLHEVLAELLVLLRAPLVLAVLVLSSLFQTRFIADRTDRSQRPTTLATEDARPV